MRFNFNNIVILDLDIEYMDILIAQNLSSILVVESILCLKLKISENSGPNWLYFSEKLHECLKVVLGYFNDLSSLPLEARVKGFSMLIKMEITNSYKFIFVW